MDVTLIVSIIGLLTTVLGGGRWLLEVWFKKSEGLENLKHENHQLKIVSLKSEADNIRKEFESMKVVMGGELEKLRIEMAEFRNELKRVVGKYQENQQSGLKVLEALDRFTAEMKNTSDEHNRRIQFVETEVKNYGQVIIRDAKDGSRQ